MKKTSKKSSPEEMRRELYPPSIKKGDTIGLICPASSLVDRKLFADGMNILEKKGFKLKFMPKLLNTKGYLAGTDKERADCFNSLWADNEVKALVTARGGYGCLRMIAHIDMRQIRKNPKILIGFSDITVLLNAIRKKTGLITYHGPVVTTLSSIDKESRKSFFDTLLGKRPENTIHPKVKILKPGKTTGILYGGNLTTLIHLIGTPYEIPWNKAVLFIEDIGESPYRLDRLLTHLHSAKRLQKIKGLILGSFTDEERKEKSVLLKTVCSRITELLGDTDIPVWSNFPVGHARKNRVLPVGSLVTMDSSSRKLKFDYKNE